MGGPEPLGQLAGRRCSREPNAGARRGRAGLGRGWNRGQTLQSGRCRRSRRRQTCLRSRSARPRWRSSTPVSPGCPVVPVPSPPAAPGKAGGSRVCFSMLTLALCDVAFGNLAPPAFLSQTWPVVRTPCVPCSHRLPVTGLLFSCPFKRKGLFPSCTPCSISHRYSSLSSIAVLVSRAVGWPGRDGAVCLSVLLFVSRCCTARFSFPTLVGPFGSFTAMPERAPGLPSRGGVRSRTGALGGHSSVPIRLASQAACPAWAIFAHSM